MTAFKDLPITSQFPELNSLQYAKIKELLKEAEERGWEKGARAVHKLYSEAETTHGYTPNTEEN